MDTLETLDENVHIVLLGDSTMDNGRYLNFAKGELSVERQLLKICIEHQWDLTVLAQDGSMLEDVRQRQLPLVPEGATHLVLSASGNDLLSLLNQMVVANFTMNSMYTTIGSGLTEVAENYRLLVEELKRYGCHVAICTTYRPNFNHLFFKSLATFSLGLHNSRLNQISVDLDVSVIDLANMFEGDADFANPLELSTRGGGKLVNNIAAFVTEHPISRLGRRSQDITTEEESYAPTFGAFGIPLKCCATRSLGGRKVYSSKVAPDKPQSMQSDAASGRENLTPALQFSQEQEHWRQGAG